LEQVVDERAEGGRGLLARGVVEIEARNGKQYACSTATISARNEPDSTPGTSPARLLEMLSDRFGALEAVAHSSIKLARHMPEPELSMDLLVAEAVLEFGDDLRTARDAATQSGATSDPDWTAGGRDSASCESPSAFVPLNAI
jgi:hypothetical protein